MTTKTKVLPIRKVIPFTKVPNELLSKSMAITTKSEIRVIDLDDILYLKSDSNYTEIHLADDSKILTSNTLKKYEMKLNALLFMRVHNSYIIQKSQIAAFLPNSNSILLRNSQEIPVSRNKRKQLITYLKTLMV